MDKLTLPAKTETPKVARPVLRLVLPGKPALSEQYDKLAEEWRSIETAEHKQTGHSRWIAEHAAAKTLEYLSAAREARAKENQNNRLRRV